MTIVLSESTLGNPAVIPPFVPHPLVRNGHLQTIVGRYLVGPRAALPSTDHLLDVSEGDRLLLHESVPEGWSTGGPTALFVHGLAGCARSPYVVRVAARLWNKGVRVVRVNLRGAGAGFGLAKGIYHAGRSEDLRRVVEWMSGRAPGSPVALIGFSLGGNLVLKLAAEAALDPLQGFDCVLAANPPIDLAECCRVIQLPANRLYDQNFARILRKEICRLHAAFPDLGPMNLPKKLTVFQFDDLYTAPRIGFDGAYDYYAKSSAAPLIPGIQHPGLVVHSEDDPFIPAEPFRKTQFPEQLALELILGGGHLGYLSHRRWAGDYRWLDTRLVTWLTARWSLR